MKTDRYWLPLLTIGLNIWSSACTSGTENQAEEASTMDYINQVNAKWQAENPAEEQWPFWHNATYHIGNLAAYEHTQSEEQLSYTVAWAEANEWAGAKSENKEEWKFSYGETEEHVLFGDWQACFQAYIDLYHLAPAEHKIARATEVMTHQINTPEGEYWWWIDGLFMVMPVMPRMYELTGDTLFLDKLHEYYSYTKSLMYDEEAGLWYRDTKYLYPEHQTNTGKKDFWSRGNGWVLAAHARTLDKLPKTDAHYAEYLTVFKKMAAALKDAQQEEGYWTRSLLDPTQAPGPETSGTAFFTYGMLWGINHEVLDADTYRPVVEDAWQYLTTVAVQPDGTLGYVQPIGERADPNQIVNSQATSDFGVGAFLLAASEMIKYTEGN